MKRISTLVLLFCLSGAALAGGAGEETYTTAEYRFPIKVLSKDRNRLLYDMRDLLHGMHNIHHALARNDMKAVATEARPLGQLINHMPASQRDSLPEGFMQMGIAMYESFEQMAKMAEGGASQSQMEEQMAEVVAYCSGCHDTYRFEVAKRLPRR